MEREVEGSPHDSNGSGAIRQAAHKYAGRGWSVIPVPHMSKAPTIKRWGQLRLTVDTIDGHFNGHPTNIGVLLGEPSGWLIDIDLDHARAVELAGQFLPPTDAVFGRKSRPRSHWVYRVTAPTATKKFKSKSAGMLVEVRSTGMQTVFPPSTHECGEAIEWAEETHEPALVDPTILLASVQRLADAVLVELGEKQTPRAKPKRVQPCEPVEEVSSAQVDSITRRARCLAAMLRIAIADKQDGSHRLFACACRAIEHDLSDADALAILREYCQQRPFQRSWSDEEVIQRLRDAERRSVRGYALEVDADGCVPLGQYDPPTGRLVLSQKRTLPTAQAFVRDFHVHADGNTVVSYAGQMMQWQNNHYREIEDEAVRLQLQPWLHDASRYVFNRGKNEFEVAPFECNPTTVKAALDSLRTHVHVPVTTTSPAWLKEATGMPMATQILPCRSQLLHLPTMKYFPSTPRFFSTNALEFDPDPAAADPTQWLAFLHQLFDGDLDALELLQNWFGYCLTGDTSQQKMLLIVGPKRSGKGTIARVLTRLIGMGNVCGPTTSSLAGPFGLQPLIGKTLAIVSDARFHGDNIATVVERLLCISGEDLLSIDRKFLGSVSMKLPTRFVFLTNEFPKFTDSSGALVGRFVILRLTETFYGKEDIELTNRLITELPGILNWAIEGWHRLHTRGHFVMPSSVEEVVREIEDLSSPVSAFIRDLCVVGPGNRIEVDELYGEWRKWCDASGRQQITTKQTFGRDLAAAVPGVLRRRGTGMTPFYSGITLKGSW